VGEIVANSIKEFFLQEQTIDLLQRLKTAGVNTEEADSDEMADQRFEGKTFVLTGKLDSFTRDEAQDIIEKLEETSKLEIEKTQNKIDGFIVEQQQRMVQTFSLIDSEKTNKLNDINKCFEDACAIVEQIRELKDNIRNENGQSKS
jgi:hypothetical protein